MMNDFKAKQTKYGEAVISLVFTGSMVCCAKAKDIPKLFGGEKVCAKTMR